MNILKIFLTLLFVFSLITCNSGPQGTTTIKINLQGNKSKTISANTIYSAGQYPEGVHHIRVAVYSDATSDTSNLVFENNFDKNVQQATFDIESGEDRIIVLEAMTVVNTALYRGSETIDLEPDTTVSIEINMKKVEIEYASINITMKYMLDSTDDSTNFDFNTHAGDLSGDKITLSYFTPANEVFNKDNPDDIEISCTTPGDTDPGDTVITDNGTIPPVDVPANTYLIIVARAFSESASVGDLSLLGFQIIKGTELAPNTSKDVSVVLRTCNATNYPSEMRTELDEDTTGDSGYGWVDICECR